MQNNFLYDGKFFIDQTQTQTPSNIPNKGDPNKEICRGQKRLGFLFYEEAGKMGTQQKYLDACVLCGRDLDGRGSKRYWPAHRIREVFPEYKGKEAVRGSLGVPHEEGGYVCRSRFTCDKIRQDKAVRL